eukprot:2282197-Ditylum_brightwellii.AAC.1
MKFGENMAQHTSKHMIAFSGWVEWMLMTSVYPTTTHPILSANAHEDDVGKGALSHKQFTIEMIAWLMKKAGNYFNDPQAITPT